MSSARQVCPPPSSGFRSRATSTRPPLLQRRGRCRSRWNTPSRPSLWESPVNAFLRSDARRHRGKNVGGMPTRQDSALRKLVDLDKGLVAREIYVNEDIFRQELERVFARAWLFVGHESQIPNPGDFVVSRMGAEEVLLVRDRKAKVHVFLNTCRHRGMKVCRYDDGNTLVFTCPFHGWSYDTDGRLVGVPYFKAAYKGRLDKTLFGLHEVAQMTNYYGSIWATWDSKAPSFEAYLGPYADAVRRCFEATDGTDAGVELFKPVYKWRIPCNWKFPAVSFDGDRAHAAMTHRSINVAAIGPQGDRNGGSRHVIHAERSQTNYEMSAPELGHGGPNTNLDAQRASS